MLLSPDDAKLFFRLHRTLMHFVNQQCDLVPGLASPEELAALPPETRLLFRRAVLNDPDLIGSFVAENTAELDHKELAIVSSWRHQISGKFIVFRQLKKYMIFLSADSPPVAYGVVALTEPIEDLVGPNLPALIETVLMPFKDKLVYDGTLGGYNVIFGGGVKRGFNESYREAKQRLGIVTALPIESAPVATAKSVR